MPKALVDGPNGKLYTSSLVLPRSLHQSLRVMAAHQGRSLAALMRDAIQQYYDAQCRQGEAQVEPVEPVQEEALEDSSVT